MRWVQTAIDDEALWELGMERGCVHTGGFCRYDPCTVAQGIRCCAECMLCHSPCRTAMAKGVRT